MTTLGQRLQSARAEKKLSQRQVVEKLNDYGIESTQATISRYESDEFDTPASIIRALSRIYDIDPSLLLFDESEL